MNSNIALVEVVAYHFKPGKLEPPLDDCQLFSADVEDDGVVTQRQPIDSEVQQFPYVVQGAVGQEFLEDIAEVQVPFWAFRLTPIGDWVADYSNGVAVMAEEGGWDLFDEDIPTLVKLAEDHEQAWRQQLKVGRELAEDRPIAFVVAYTYQYRSAHYTGDDDDSWVEFLGEVDLDQVAKLALRK
jgi:hypothetical protein